MLPIGVGVACADVDTAASAARAGEITADGASALPVVIVEPCAPPREQDQCRAVQRAWPRPPERHARAWHRVHAWGLSRAALALTRAWRCPERAWRFRAIFLGCAWARGGWVQRTVASELILGVRNTEGRLSKMLCDATKYFDERPSPNRVSHAGARCDGIRNLPRIARRKQPPAPLSTLCLLPLSHLPRRRPRPCRHAVPPPSHRAYALGLSLRAARRSSPPSTSPSQEIKGGAPNENRVSEWLY